MTDDDSLKPVEEEEIDLGSEDHEDDFEIDPLLLGKKKSKKLPDEDDSLDDLAEEEDEKLPEDSFDDEDLW